MLILVVSSLLLAAQAAPAPEPAPRAAVSSLVSEFCRPLVDSGKVVGMSVGVIDGDHTAVFGLGAVQRKTGAAVPDGSTLYEIGSVSKVFTATLLGQMVESGEIALDEPLQSYVPDGVTVPTHGEQPITPRLIATHFSGLPRLPDNLKPNPFDPYRDYTPDDLFAFLNRCRLERDPGAQFEYSNYAVGLLGHLLALRAGRADYEALLLDRVARPLGMSDTGLRVSDDRTGRFAQGYSRLGLPAGRWEILTLGGAGGIRSTVDDLLKFARFELHPDDSDLGKGSRLAQTPIRPVGDDANGTRTGLGWLVEPNGVVWHNGQTGGYHSFLGLRPGAGKAVVILTNSSSGEVDGAGMRLLNALGEKGSSGPVEPR